MPDCLGLRRRRFGLKSREMKEVLEKGRRRAGRCMVLCVARGEGGFKYGVSASRRVGNAAMRNRAKRLLREVIRLNRNQIKIPCRIAVIARAGMIHNSFACIKMECANLLSEEGLLGEVQQLVD